jgi:hypothetical protein
MSKSGEDKALVAEEGGRGVDKPKVPSNVYLLVSVIVLTILVTYVGLLLCIYRKHNIHSHIETPLQFTTFLECSILFVCNICIGSNVCGHIYSS